MSLDIPVALFAYNRPAHLQRTLDCLRSEPLSQLYAFSDGPRTPEAAAPVAQVRQILRAIDWCEVVLVERPKNFGLGRSVRMGVTAVLDKHPALIVTEDDLIMVPGTYAYLTSALNQYQDQQSVMSVTGWTHHRVLPAGVGDRPYFDGRAECWVWGTWARAWRGMEVNALQLMRQCRERGIDVYGYGADLPKMAVDERRRNIWAVRWLYHHIRLGGLCLRPPHSLVEHIGFDNLATNFTNEGGWSNPPLLPCPSIPTTWPAAIENPECARLWQQAAGPRPTQYHQAIDLVRQFMAAWVR